MDRKSFIKLLSFLPLSRATMNLNDLSKLVEPFGPTPLMPILFLGHGSPMNAIEENEFTKSWKALGKTLPKPNAILCISAHWETKGTFVTALPKPRTIHDFGGFPNELFEVQYNAPGSKELADETKSAVKSAIVGLDEKWGLDHGCWSVLKHLYPDADVPVVQLSLDYTLTPQRHFEIGKELEALRSKGVLIIGSGNIVHNLGMIAWDKMQEPDYGYDWAIEANDTMKKYMLSGDFEKLISYKSQGKAFDLAIPTPDHYLPLLYVLALKKENEKLTIFNDKALMGSLTMTSLQIG